MLADCLGISKHSGDALCGTRRWGGRKQVDSYKTGQSIIHVQLLVAEQNQIIFIYLSKYTFHPQDLYLLDHATMLQFNRIRKLIIISFMWELQFSLLD